MPHSTVAWPITTSDGIFLARFSTRGLCQLDFPPVRNMAPDANTRKKTKAASPEPGLARWVDQTRLALLSALDGRLPKKLPPLDLAVGTDFQQQVWRSLGSVPPGQTRTYAQLAAAIKRPKAARAVGQACGANPIPVLIPCHRVVAAHGGLGGFSGGLHWKRLLLEREAAPASTRHCATR